MKHAGLLLALILPLACVDRLPNLPPAEAATTFYLEGLIKRGVSGRIEPVPYPGARLEVMGLGAFLADDEGRVLLPNLASPAAETVWEMMVFSPEAGADETPEHRFEYTVRAGARGQVRFDTTVGARGAIGGRVERRPGGGEPSEGGNHAGVIVFVDGVPGADDISGPNGEFFIYGVPAGQASLRFMYEDYTVAPDAFRIADVRAYQTTTLDEAVVLQPPAGQAATAPVDVLVRPHDGIVPSDLELVLTPVTVASNLDEQTTRVVAVPASGSLQVTFAHPVPHQLVLRSKDGKRPIKPARRSHVVPGLGVMVFQALPSLGDPATACPDGQLRAADGLYACGDLDGDGFDDAIDTDDDGDGISDLEELTPGQDDQTSDHRDATFSRAGAPGVDAGEAANAGRVNAVDDSSIRSAIEALSARRGEQLLGKVITVDVGDAVMDISAQYFAYAGHHNTLHLMTMPRCGVDCAERLRYDVPQSRPLDCTAAARGRKTCPAEALSVTLEEDTLLWYVTRGGPTATVTCGNGVVDPGEDCDDGNGVDDDGCDGQCHSPHCGNALVEFGEDCDDGNLLDDDGCSNACRAVGPATIQQLSAGGYHSCALYSDHTVKCWGLNDVGQLGIGSTENALAPVAVTDLDGATHLDLGPNHSCAVVEGGEVRCWGRDFGGNLGTGEAGDQHRPAAVQGLDPRFIAVEVAAGHKHSCARSEAGAVSCWGANANGQLGLDPMQITSLIAPSQQVVGLVEASQLAAGQSHNCVVINGGASCWGKGDTGELGDDAFQSRHLPSLIAFNEATMAKVVAGESFACGLTDSGGVVCWGGNGQGRLGLGPDAAGVHGPTVVPNLTGVTQLDASWAHSCARTDRGQVWCWGANTDLRCGQPGGEPVLSPSRVELPEAVSVAVGGSHSCALLASGLVHCWGRGTEGQLGNNQQARSSGPVQVQF